MTDENLQISRFSHNNALRNTLVRGIKSDRVNLSGHLIAAEVGCFIALVVIVLEKVL